MSILSAALNALPVWATRPTAQTHNVLGLGPSSLEVGTHTLKVSDTFAATLAVADYPAEVAAGWLEPLLSFPARISVAVHIEPVPTPIAADRLRKQRARLESGRRHAATHGHLDDPVTEAAAADARELAYRVACGEGKLFGVGIYLTIHADSADELAELTAQVRSLAEGMLLRLVPATFRTVQGWCSTLPLGLDLLKIRRTFDTEALATLFPFTSGDLPLPQDSTSAVLLGVNATDSGLVMWDRWAAPNHNSVVLAQSGAGKSYLAKLDVLRNLYQGVEVMVIDPEQEYVRLAHAVGGTVVSLGAPGVRINPFDLPATGDRSDAIRRRALFGHTVVAVLLGRDLTAGQHAALDAAILNAYERAGITADPRTHRQPAPTLRDIVELLGTSDAPDASALAAELIPHTSGSFSGLFDGPTAHSASGHLAVFALRELSDELKPIGTLLTLDLMWRRVSDPANRRRRLVVVDEAWWLMKEPAGARFLFRMAKASRKCWAGLSVVTQDAADLLSTELGMAVVSNAASAVLLRQAPQSVDQITHAFRLSAGERAFLLSAGRGQGLVMQGNARAAFSSVASAREDELCTTDPAQLARLDEGWTA
jgi:type IV secretory pathway VirB4 component